MSDQDMRSEERKSRAEDAGAARRRAVEAVARRYLRIETLERRHRDALDFHHVSVWDIEAALAAAYDAGCASMRIES